MSSFSIMKSSARRAAAIVATCTPAISFAGTGVAVVNLSHGMSMVVMDSAVSCNGGPAAFVHDRDGRKKDQTCNVRFTPDGVRVLFAGYGKPVFFSKDQFSFLPAP